jgi:hypothetical protein
MSVTKTAEEVLAQYIEAMGQELGEFFNATSDELSLINWRWNQYRTLFGEEPSRIDLLNEAAPFFFHIVHNVLFEDTILAIARIVGPSQSVGKPNLTIGRIPDLVHRRDLKVRVSELVASAQKLAVFALDWRHRHLAHRDLGLALGNPKVQPLALVTREQVEGSLSGIRDVLDYVEENYCKAHTAYSFRSIPGDARQLLYIIENGLSHERERRARWERGEFHNDDLPR